MDAELAAPEAAGQIASASERVSVEFGGAPRGAGERDAVDASRSALAGTSTAPSSASKSGPLPALLPPNSHAHPRAHVNGVPAHASAAASSAARHAVSLNAYKRRLQQSSSSSPFPPELPQEQQLGSSKGALRFE